VGGGEDPCICVGGREMDSTPLLDAKQVMEASAVVAMVSSPRLTESVSLPKKAHTKGYLPPFARYVCVECHEPFHTFSPLVLEREIRWSLSR
jgi:hypothetical protein